ncbi:MAG: hypothetical protein NZ899_07125 [Thermoguttaceae bacterium]|nr:hypothetical protein [Thermoguttaceae bacterium]MDW8079675.1 hypothetical protein [Thermoguttaceae bacterium]
MPRTSRHETSDLFERLFAPKLGIALGRITLAAVAAIPASFGCAVILGQPPSPASLTRTPGLTCPQDQNHFICRLTDLLAFLDRGASASASDPEFHQSGGGDSTDEVGNESPLVVKAIPFKLVRLASLRFSQRDTNRDGKLSQSEWPEAKEVWSEIDRNQDGTVDREEYLDWLARYAAGRRIRLKLPTGSLSSLIAPPEAKQTPPGPSSPLPTQSPEGSPVLVPPLTQAGKPAPSAVGSQRVKTPKFYVPPESLPSALPRWFASLDSDGDGQLTTAEFLAEGGPQRIEEFSRYDLDGDGVLTPQEVLAGPKSAQGSASAPGERASETAAPSERQTR